MGMSCIIKVCLVLVTVVLQTDGKPPHIIFIVADDLGEFLFYVLHFALSTRIDLQKKIVLKPIHVKYCFVCLFFLNSGLP